MPGSALAQGPLSVVILVKFETHEVEGRKRGWCEGGRRGKGPTSAAPPKFLVHATAAGWVGPRLSQATKAEATLLQSGHTLLRLQEPDPPIVCVKTLIARPSNSKQQALRRA